MHIYIYIHLMALQICVRSIHKQVLKFSTKYAKYGNSTTQHKTEHYEKLCRTCSQITYYMWSWTTNQEDGNLIRMVQ